MITTFGKVYIKRYLAGQAPAIAQSIAFGIGDSAETLTEDRLKFEVSRSDVILVSYDFIGDRVIFKANVPDEIAGSIREVALFSVSENEAAGEFASKLITTFDSGSEDWVDSTGEESVFIETNVRVGEDALSLAPAPSTTASATLNELFLDLSGYSNADKFSLAANIVGANVSAIRVKFLTDASNYYQVAWGAQTNGYKILQTTKASATVTGNPDWSNITSIAVESSSSSGGTGTVNFDGLRVEDVDSLNTDFVMISREVLSTPYIKQEGKSQEIEFSLGVNI